LHWIVHEIGDEPCVFVQEASSLIYARLEASQPGMSEKFIEAHELDSTTAKNFPRDVIGQSLSRTKARAALQRRQG
jgi:hypothetical protein